MVIRYESEPRREAVKTPFWSRTAAGWCQGNGTGEATFVRPGRPLSWRRDDPDFGADCDDLDRDADRLVLETVRRRAIGGDHHAQGLSFRAARGFARPVDVSPVLRISDPLPPDVAAAMIEAGLAAINASAWGPADSYPL